LSPPADESDPSVRDATSNKDLDEILGQLVDSTDSVSYRPNISSDSQNFFEANQNIPLCKRCTCKTCKRRLDYAKKNGKKQALDTIAN
jgi:hypothetical protein